MHNPKLNRRIMLLILLLVVHGRFVRIVSDLVINIMETISCSDILYFNYMGFNSYSTTTWRSRLDSKTIEELWLYLYCLVAVAACVSDLDF